MSLLVIYNPVCGDKTAQTFFESEVIPLLESSGKTPAQVIATDHAGHAGEIVLDHLQQSSDPLTIVLGSGDGTLHEIVAALHESKLTFSHSNVSVVLVPCGTANALYWSLFKPDPQEASDPLAQKLKSLRAFLAPTPTLYPLLLSITSLCPANLGLLRNGPPKSVATVVVSTALHAAILHDSEALRATHPGIERFKIAAMQNITKWYKSIATLYPPPNSPHVQIYDSKSKQFVPVEGPKGQIELGGPFAYFLSTVNVDRLESAFRIAPLHSSIPPSAEAPTLDVVVVRPLGRDPSVKDDSEETKAQFAQKSGNLLGAAYRDGAHIDLKYGIDGSVVEGEDGPSVVEYYRVGWWEWVPDPEDPAAHFVCVDGEIFELEPIGRAICTVQKDIKGVQFSVYV